MTDKESAMDRGPYTYGDILVVRLVPGRIERDMFVVTSCYPVHGGGQRYNGIFPGNPTLFGHVYSDDVVSKGGTVSATTVQFHINKRK